MPFFRVGLIVSLVATSVGEAGEWPQILGPDRNGAATEERIGSSLDAADFQSTDGRPAKRLRWSRQDIGDGFAGVAITGEIAYFFHRVGDAERIEAFRVSTGNPDGPGTWKSDSPTNYSGAIASDNGPRCVPTVTEKHVIVYGAQGNLRCLDRKTGSELWSNPTQRTFGAQEGYFGAGSSPIVDGDLVLVNVGASRSNAGIVAFDLNTGDVKWKSTSEQPSYSSPIITTTLRQRTAIFVTRYNCVGIEPSTGKELWSIPFGARGPTVNAANPVVWDDRILLTASYGVGAAYLQLLAQDAKEIWRDKTLLASQYTTPIAHEGVLYGIDGRQDVGEASLRCIDPEAREVLWEEENFGYATIIKADGKLLIQKTDGTLVLVKPDKTSYQELSRVRLFPGIGTVRALPALADSLYLVRDEKRLYCFNLAP